jgi:hypothetical protein
MPTIDALRAARDDHAKQIEAVNWLTVNDLAARWGIAPGSVRKIPRAALGYLLFGASRQRRYDPRDVETFEREQKQADEARAS